MNEHYAKLLVELMVKASEAVQSDSQNNSDYAGYDVRRFKDEAVAQLIEFNPEEIEND